MVDIVPAAVWSREKWRTLTPMSLPARELWVHHGAIGNPDLATLRSYDRYHVRNRGWSALGYSYAITGDGTVYQGRGRNIGAHTSGRNTVSLGVCLVGAWSRLAPPRPMVEALAGVVRHLYDTGALARPAIDGGHGQAPGQSTTCPGRGGLEAIVEARRLLAEPATEEDIMATLDDDDLERIAKAVWYYRMPDSGKGDGFDGESAFTALRSTAVALRSGVIGGRAVPNDLRLLRLAVRDLVKRAGGKTKHDPPETHGV